MEKLVKDFCNRKYLRQKHTIELQENSNREYVYLEDPIVFARLAGEIKHRLGRPSKGAQIFMRGQTDDHKGMVPSIFREIQNKDEYSKRCNAYNALGKYIKQIAKAKRFEGEVGNAILQHYGVKTSWLDLVDNIFIALWFACWERVEHEDGYKFQIRKPSDFGWVYFLQFDFSESNPDDIVIGSETKYCDLRSSTTSLVLRAHTQHGIFGTLNHPESSNYDMNKLVVATVKFPINKFVSFVNRHEIITPKYMFPSDYYDNTYKLLHRLKIKGLIKRVESEFGLSTGALGTIDTYYHS